jgi:hypothetical protein
VNDGYACDVWGLSGRGSGDGRLVLLGGRADQGGRRIRRCFGRDAISRPGSGCRRARIRPGASRSSGGEVGASFHALLTRSTRLDKLRRAHPSNQPAGARRRRPCAGRASRDAAGRGDRARISCQARRSAPQLRPARHRRMGSGAGPLCAGAALRRADPPPQRRARRPSRLASAGQSGRAAAVRGGPRPRSGPPRLRRQAAPDRTRRPGALPILRQAFLLRLFPGSLPALRATQQGARATDLRCTVRIVGHPSWLRYSPTGPDLQSRCASD